MSILLADEFRLLWAALLNVAVLGGAWRLARRWTPNRLDAAGDALLLYFLVQYLSTCATGLMGALHPLTITLVGALLSAAMLAGGWARRMEPTPPRAVGELSRATLIASIAVVTGYSVALIWHQRHLPVISNDAITYHLPAAVQWLQTGRLGLYEAWFYNPANSYSPLGGSAFIAWLIAPMGNDVLGRFVQFGPMALMLVGLLNLCRRLGVTSGVAAAIAAAAVLARPFMSQTILTKDDLFVAAFFIVAVDAMQRQRLEQRAGPWRLGIALGLLLATKYTVLLSLPILLLAIGRGWTWRRAVIVLACCVLLAGPWYLRNWILVGNPLYPTTVKIAGVTLFPGMLEVHRSELLRTVRGAWNVFTGGYYAMPVILVIILAIAWCGAVWVAVRTRTWRQPLVRTCLLGPVIGITLFIALAPYGEMRFAYPSLALLFASAGIALSRLPLAAQVGMASAGVAVAAMTAFLPQKSIAFSLIALLATGIALATYFLRHVRLLRAAVTAAAATAAVIGSLIVSYSYLRLGPEEMLYGWQVQYGVDADVWGYVRTELPSDATVAYANTFFTYPLQGFAYDHRVVYAPTRAGLERFIEMPRIEQPMTGEEIVGHVVRMLRQDPDQRQWLRRLRETGVTHLVVMTQDPVAPGTSIVPPEMTFAREMPETFQPLFEHEAGAVYRITW